MKAWNRYFFDEVPLHALALYRFLFCGLVCLEAAHWFPYTEELFSTEGFHIRYSFFSAILSPLEAKIFCGLLVVSALFASLGYFTRLSLVITLICYAILHSVDSINEKAVETVCLVVLTVLIFSPCGSLYSLDVASGRRPRRERGCVFAQRFLQWEFAQIYFFCGVTKMMVPEWPAGKVFLDSLTGRWASDFGIWVSSWIPDWAARAFGFGTIIFEIHVGPALLTGARIFAVPAAILFHFGIEAMLQVGSLGWQFIIADLCLFLNPEMSAKIILAVQGYAFARWVDARSYLQRLRPGAATDGEVFS